MYGARGEIGCLWDYKSIFGELLADPAESCGTHAGVLVTCSSPYINYKTHGCRYIHRWASKLDGFGTTNKK